MPCADSAQLRKYAETIVRVGLNLRPGQRLLIAEPYELQGVARAAAGLVAEIRVAAARSGGGRVRVLWGDERRLQLAVRRGAGWFFHLRLKRHAAVMRQHISRGDALLFLQSSHPHLLGDVPVDRAADFRRRTSRTFGRIAARLTAGATNWTAVCAPTPAWADAVYPDLPAPRRLAALWGDVLAACRIHDGDPAPAWWAHLDVLARRRDELNARRPAGLHFRGPDTDLRVALPEDHVWCTANLTTQDGRPFVANLPTDEIFTLPRRDSAAGVVRVARPVVYGGRVMEGMELEFHHGAVVRARARSGGETLERMLATDPGACRLGEVALVPEETSLSRTGRLFYHPLLDENASHHLALGEAYAFTFRSAASARPNRSLIHVDLPLGPVEATVLP